MAEQKRDYENFLRILNRSTSLLKEDPVREEIFSIERLEQYAEYLADELTLSSNPKRGRFILPQLIEHGHQLLFAYKKLTEAVRTKQTVSPAAEWFIDNFHIVEEQLREIKQDLPKSYYDELPKLHSGELEGYPRVYAIALAIIAHTDSRLDGETLKRFLRSFQRKAPLTIGELWAFAITLRIALTEHLAPLAVRIEKARKKRTQANELADDLFSIAARPGVKPEDLLKVLRVRVGHSQQFDRAFIVQLTLRLRDQESDLLPALAWLEDQLHEHYATSTEQLTQLEHHRQATAQVTVGNIITSMRLLSALDWRNFVESVSLVDELLSQDPSGLYDKMDFSTRDSYRHAVEKISKQSKLNELQIAARALARARGIRKKGTEPALIKAYHVGYHLIGDGRFELEKEVSYSPSLGEKITRFFRRHPTCFYLGLLALLTALFTLPVFYYFRNSGGSDLVNVLFCLIALVPASEFALSILNHNVALLMKPKRLPKLDMEKGVPATAKTMVVIPTLLTRENAVEALIENLQVHFLANQDPHIYFAILTDFADADIEKLPSDEIILLAAQRGIDTLNEKYSKETEKRFFLFHRGRQYNASEEKWIGYERKRGKLHEFNRLLRGATDTSYLKVDTSYEFFAQIKYVLTLDTDTQLPRGAAHQLIGTILHPLNRPEFDPKKGRVVEGYGILQPRVSVSLVSANRSRFAQLFSGCVGLDPYATACSDVYQDLFLEGSYTGKGLYDVDAFEAALFNRVPENSVLSHDLFEGSFARSALVSDVEVFDDYPSDYETYSARQHRWIRGDWQMAPWLLPRVRNACLQKVPNPLTILAKWKILDNLRRSLVPVASLMWLLLAWSALPGSPLLWTLMVVVLFVFPVYASVTNIFHHRQGNSWRGHFTRSWSEGTVQIQQILLMLIFMAEQASNQIDAIARTLVRLVRRKKLLEWRSFAESRDDTSRTESRRQIWGPGPRVAFFALLLIIIRRPEAMGIAAPFLIAWVANPAFKKWIKKKAKRKERPLNKKEILAYRLYARRTWHFFEVFVTKQGNYLAPDNFQEEPQPVIAHRTSPTNIGLQLLSLSSAFDFGYIGLLDYVESAEKIFNTLSKLKQVHGHFFNWYDTQTLEPLNPQYISTVDSGNLAGHLLTFKQSLSELRGGLFLDHKAKKGLIDTLSLLRHEAYRIERFSSSAGAASLQQFQESIDTTLNFAKSSQWKSLFDFLSFIKQLQKRLSEAKDILDALSLEGHSDLFRDIAIWLECAIHQGNEFERDLTVLTPSSRNYEKNLENLRDRQLTLIEKCDEFFRMMDFKFLFDEQRKIFVIGFNVAEGRRDNSYYDLLASESRLASFIAIAKGDVPQEHWFRLGRQMTSVKRGRALISWTATMFEYLMPLLVMRRYSDTLLDQTYQSVVARQIEYGKAQGVPWGISEAGFNARDLQLIYQYGPFGVPGLGLKRGLSDDLVISPYSTLLAAMIDPISALLNLRVLEDKGALARYGFYESIDYTPERLQKNQKSFILRSFMAHHQGMSLVAINNLLNENVMQKRFHAEPLVKATELLLQERIPFNVTTSRPRAEEVHYEGIRFSTDWNPRVYSEVDLPTPRTQLLSNGTYSVMLTSSGSGYSRSGEFAVNRWREDVTQDHWGEFFYIRNRNTGRLWSSGYHPTRFKPKKYEVTFAEDKVEFLRRDGTTTTHTEVIVSPEDNVEIRRISLTNNSTQAREFEITSFMEIALALPQDDIAHPAFSNLFVQTEYLPGEKTLLATRRRRSKTEKQIWGFHAVVPEGETIGAVQYETDRSRFIGRGRNPSNAFCMMEDRPLSDTVGSVLDPIFSLRQSLRIPPGETIRVSFSTGVASSKEEAISLAEKYHDIHIFSREAELAWTRSRVQLRHLNISSDEAHTFQRLAGRVIFSDSSLRPKSHTLSLNTKTQAGLWAYGISGDLPIILARIRNEKEFKLVRQLLHGHEYLRLKGLSIDLVLLNETNPSYLLLLQDELQRQIRMSGSHAWLDKPGGIFIRRTDIMPKEDIILLRSVARVDIDCEKGTLEEQIKRRPAGGVAPPELIPSRRPFLRTENSITLAIPPLEFFNGLGGFTESGRHYVIVLKNGQWTPSPWINVIANEKDFGFIISESGGGYTWSANSRENRLTSWSNDAVTDPVSEAIYIRDEETGEVWTPTPLPIRGNGTYVIRHGQGYSQFEHVACGISSELQIFVPLDGEVKISYLRLKNTSTITRKLSVTSYVEWVLGSQRSTSAHHVNTEKDASTDLLLARNSYNNEFNSRIAFSGLSKTPDSFTCDRKSFLGRNGNLSAPAALRRQHLCNLSGSSLDPCAALQKKFSLAPDEEFELVFLLGQVNELEQAQALARYYRDIEKVREAFKKVVSYWDEILGAIQIKTPDVAMDMIMNRWLLYQTLACRVWARTAFYQSGGAFGFRDQLQDVMALVYAKPEIARQQILRAAARQFVEGDVQHWWHPPTGRGVRTHFSDDLIWLPFVTCFYVKITGDRTILNEVIPFIETPLVDPSQDSLYTQPTLSKESGTLLEHCSRTLDRSLKVGAHGLPLMGTGDWNDGMNRVGHEGKGESVWVAWFLYATLEEFLNLIAHAEPNRATIYRKHNLALKKALEENSWDGGWYRRAYFDDGSPLGSAENEECRIDSIAQSWAILSGAGDPQRALRAMAAVDQHLIDQNESLIKLFTPPFDKSSSDPGYIKGYVPGVRENGGQYTHAAIWILMAFAKSGDGDRAAELYSLLNPINHSASRAGLNKYKVEPYVVAADIYGMWPHIGRGGWTWYTGSASWMYRAGLESILGFELRNDTLKINPCIPRHWKGFEINYVRGSTQYSIIVKNVGSHALEKNRVDLDGQKLESQDIPLSEDGKSHLVEIYL